LLVLLLSSEASLGFTHLVEAVSIVVIFIVMVFKDLFFLCTEVLVLELGDDFLLFLATLGVLEVIHVQLILQVVNVGILLNVDGVEAFELSLQPFILLLVLRLDILYSSQTLVSTL